MNENIPKSKVNIRRAKSSDIPAILEMFEARARWMQIKGIKQWSNHYADRYNANYLNMEMGKGSILLVAEENESVNKDICGFVMLKNEDILWEGEDDSLDCPSFYIHHLCTNGKIKGLGKELLQACIYHGIKANKEYLRCDTVLSNNKLTEFYTNCGFALRKADCREFNGRDYHHNKWEYRLPKQTPEMSNRNRFQKKLTVKGKFLPCG